MTSHKIKFFLFLYLFFFQTNINSQIIDEVIVIGDWRAISESDKDSSLIIFNEDKIDKKQYKHFEDLSYSVPNLNFAASDSRPRYFQIRGIGERSGYEGTPNSSVGFLIDDIDFSGQGGIASSYDVQQIEVYRGPQGSRMGANSLAGLVYVKTNDPIDIFFAKADLILGDYGRKDIGAVLNVPISSDLKYRMSLKKEDSDGFRKNIYLKRSDTSKKDERSYRFKLDWDLNAISSLDLVYFSNDFDNPADIWTIDGSLNTLSDRPGMDSQDSKAFGINYIFNAPTNKINLLYSKTNTDVVFSYDADWGNSLSHAPFTYDYFSETFRKRDTENFEIRLLSDDVDFGSRNFNWIVGYSVFKIKESNNKFDDGAYGDPFDGYDTFFSESFFSSYYSSKSNSLFGNLDYFLSSSLKLSFGMRWEDWVILIPMKSHLIQQTR